MKNFAKIAIAALLAVAMANAKDYRKDKPAAWEAKSVDAAIKALYGDIKPIESDVKVITPEIASNGGQIPVEVKVGVEAKSVALLQDANPESLVAVWDVVDGSIPNYYVKMKMKQTGTVTVIVEGKDGKFYKGKRSLEVALGGCEG